MQSNNMWIHGSGKLCYSLKADGLAWLINVKKGDQILAGIWSWRTLFSNLSFGDLISKLQEIIGGGGAEACMVTACLRNLLLQTPLSHPEIYKCMQQSQGELPLSGGSISR